MSVSAPSLHRESTDSLISHDYWAHFVIIDHLLYYITKCNWCMLLFVPNKPSYVISFEEGWLEMRLLEAF